MYRIIFLSFVTNVWNIRVKVLQIQHIYRLQGVENPVSWHADIGPEEQTDTWKVRIQYHQGADDLLKPYELESGEYGRFLTGIQYMCMNRISPEPDNA